MIFFKNTYSCNLMRGLVGGLILILFSCSTKKQLYNPKISEQDSLKELQKINRAFKQIDVAKKIIATGDLIVRTGNDFTSQSLCSFNQRDKTYSHCGIASIENDTLFVYHALGGEWNPDQKIRRDIIDFFADPYSNRGMGIYRFNISKLQTIRLMQTVKNLRQKGVMFDMKFDLQTDDRMYCAEFVYKSFVISTNGTMPFNISHIGNFKFIGVDDLFMQPLCKPVQKIVYQ